MLRKILQFKLKFFAQRILKKYQPIVIGITGSVGKTSAREAIYLVLKDKRSVRLSPKNYNNEIGLPLTIIGADSPGRNLQAWWLIFIKALGLLLWKDKNYPQILILEMGTDRPGDLAYLTKIAPPTISVVTGVSRSHLEYFSSLDNIRKEKQVLVENIKKTNNAGLAVLNYDNKLSREMSLVSKAPVLTYGLQAGADLRAEDLTFNFSKDGYELAGINFKLNYQGSVVPVSLPQALTESAVTAALAGAAVGIYFKFNLIEIAQALRPFSLPRGRMNILAGAKHTFIIDDTYNASPVSALAALDTLDRIQIDESATKYAILGDMLELGKYSVDGHRLVGQKFANSTIKYLIVIGEKSRDIIQGAISAGLADDYIFHFDQVEKVAPFLLNKLRAGDLILIKGSQGMRLEKIVKELLAEPERASELLVRQSPEWSKK